MPGLLTLCSLLEAASSSTVVVSLRRTSHLGVALSSAKRFAPGLYRAHSTSPP